MANILFQAFIPDVVVQVLSERGVTMAGSGTFFHQTYLAAQKAADHPIFPEVRNFPGGGAPKPVELYWEMKDLFGAPIVSGLRPHRGADAHHGVGRRPRRGPGRDRGRGHARRRAQAGQARRHARRRRARRARCGPRRPSSCSATSTPSLDADAFDEEGFFRTGDLGVLNERGMLTITGRLKDVIIRKGENVSAKEVEDHLYRHPKVADVAVIGAARRRAG